jgi:hypothetical protein
MSGSVPPSLFCIYGLEFKYRASIHMMAVEHFFGHRERCTINVDRMDENISL